ncbi:MAG: acyloxyacyl hydrolase [Burkholderiaceae bacterium]|nr:acyloxyacyl hydrolase [Burkholderiaceae bacterium]
MRAAACVAVAFAAPHASAQEGDSGRRLYVDGGLSVHDPDRARTLAVGVLLASSALPALPRTAGLLSFHWDLSLTRWQTPRSTGRGADFTQLAAAAVWRYGFGGAASGWFFDLGLGASIYDRPYFSGERRFQHGLAVHGNFGSGLSARSIEPMGGFAARPTCVQRQHQEAQSGRGRAAPSSRHGLLMPTRARFYLTIAW